MKRVKSEIASEFIDYLGEVYDACGYIHDMGGCDKCPIKHNCLDETTVTEFANAWSFSPAPTKAMNGGMTYDAQYFW